MRHPLTLITRVVARIISKLEDTDYVVLGTRPGQKKVDTINEHKIETLDEDQFYELLKTGASEEKREKMAAKGEVGPPKKKAKK